MKFNYRDSEDMTQKRNFKLANWELYRSALEVQFTSFDNDLDIQPFYDLFIKMINEAADLYIPMVKTCHNPKRGFHPKSYWNQDLSKLVAKRRLALSNFRKNPTPDNLNILEMKTKDAKSAIRRANTVDWQSYCDSINEKTTIPYMWHRLRWMKGYRSPKCYAPQNEKVELLCSLAPDYVSRKSPEFSSTNTSLEGNFSVQEMYYCIKAKDTAPGDDGITYSMIFNLPTNGKYYLLKLFNRIVNTGNIPMQWRDILVVPIQKRGSYNTANSVKRLRPISLISCICKILHSMLTKRIEWFVEKNNLLSPFTAGFRRGRSCQDCLTRLVTQIQIGFSKNQQTVACFLDIEGAYNNVLIEKLTVTMDELGFGKKLCQYIWNYLSERHLKMQDNIDNRSYITRFTYKGLAQGDPMSPILFNIVTLFFFHKIVNISMYQYADDFVLLSTNKNVQESANKMQRALNIFNEMLNELGLEISAKKSKCCIFHRGHKRPNVELQVENCSLELVEVYKYLGLWLDKSLRWGKHIGETVVKVQRCFNLLNVLAGSSWGVHTKHLRQIYLSLIRSRIDYGSVLYDSSANCHLTKLDRLQNQALRITGGFIKTTPIHVMESELCIPPLKLRRKYLARKYSLKSLSWKENETIKLIQKLSGLCSNSYWANKRIPLLVSVYEEVKEEPIASSLCLEMFTLKTWVTNIKVHEVIKYHLESVKKSKKLCEFNNLKHDVIRELRENYAGWFVIYTDGSKSAEGLGAGFYISTKNDCNLYDNDCLKIDGGVCIMTLELIAISEALSYVKTTNYKKVLICTDSKSALQHIARSASGLRGVSIAYAVLAKIDDLNSRGVVLRLQWVPSHIGLSGNEETEMK
ncbi:jg24223 [Pararge aegeria aegeria]|uniref:Jg24223 protein n=1 Tax=Pararge aegeria aegeria TaxID=348720 RepID=A0A8S4QCZ2_9NEOP|nr:jg24223 [Pararge aegeria aegeria]